MKDDEIKEAIQNLRARYGSHYEMTKLLNLRVDDDYCASLGMWKPLSMISLRRKLEGYYAKVCPDRKDIKKLVMNATKTYFYSQQLLHYHLQDKYGVGLFDFMPPPIVASQVLQLVELSKDETDLLDIEDAQDRPELRPDWNHITDTYGYFLSGKPLKGSRHKKMNKDIMASTATSSSHHHPIVDSAPRRTSMLPWKSPGNSLKSSSRGDLGQLLSRASISSMGSEKSLRARSPRRSHASSTGSLGSTPSSVGKEYEDLMQYEIMIRGSHWTWSGGLPFPNLKNCTSKCKHCRVHKTMIAKNYKCYVRISKLENSPRAETNARAVRIQIEATFLRFFLSSQYLPPPPLPLSLTLPPSLPPSLTHTHTHSYISSDSLLSDTTKTRTHLRGGLETRSKLSCFHHSGTESGRRKSWDASI